jgi:ectoine hydroxylase-related dioxygenase (phytanoyl-CoA dioxygenase family)
MAEPGNEDTRHPAAIEAHARLDRMRDEILRLGLERHVLELELYGYTVVEDVMPESFFDELRETILKLGEEDNRAGRRIPLAGPEGGSYLVTWLLARGRIFEQAILAEKPLALVTWLLGESCQISSNHGHVRVQGDPPQGMHLDTPMVPEPVPENPVTCNMMWVLDEFSLESGATLVVPGSHRKRTHPPARAIRQAIPLQAKKGSVAVFSGNLWHSAGARTIPGERVGMTCYFQRMYLRPQEDLNGVISDEVVARNPPRFAHLIGRNNPYPARDFGFFNPRGAKFFGPTGDARG